MKSSALLSAVILVGAAMLIDSVVYARGMGPKPQPTIYVTSQGLYYDSIVLTDLPLAGEFQLLVTDGSSVTGLETEFGIGDVGYLGGRWWVDGNGNGVMDSVDEGDAYFMCPLLGPGRELP